MTVKVKLLHLDCRGWRGRELIGSGVLPLFDGRLGREDILIPQAFQPLNVYTIREKMFGRAGTVIDVSYLTFLTSIDPREIRRTLIAYIELLVKSK